MRTGREVERQRHAAGVGAGQSPAAAGQEGQLLEAQAGAPQGEVVSSVVGLQQSNEQDEKLA